VPFSDDPFPEAFSALKDQRRKTFRALSSDTRAADPAGHGLSHTYIGRLARGREYPVPRAIELLSLALGVDPSYFAEYRLAQFRSHFDERVTGDLGVALTHLKRAQAALPDLVSGSPPRPGIRRGRPPAKT
jgi:transcriptional regulator with XRE-family HTH domain